MLNLRYLKQLLDEHGDCLDTQVREFHLGGRPFPFNKHPALMGVINLSEDSAYTESICSTTEAAIVRGKWLREQGSEMVDLGAESTLPHARRVSPAEQTARLIPVVQALSGEGIVVSVESYYAEVLEAAGKAGASVFNLTGNRDRKEIYKLAARFEAAVVHCHVPGETVRDAKEIPLSQDMMPKLEDYFRERIEEAGAIGVQRHIVDPGLGFYYSNLADGDLRLTHQMITCLNTFRLNKLGWPVLNILPHAPLVFGEAHRQEAEPVFAMLALLGGTHVLRTHEPGAVSRIRDLLSRFLASSMPV